MKFRNFGSGLHLSIFSDETNNGNKNTSCTMLATPTRRIGFWRNHFHIFRIRGSAAFPHIRTMTTTVTASLEETLRSALQPTHLEIRNESYKHKGPRDAESHFQVIVVSDQFDKLPLIKRHRLVNQACQSLLDGPIHALSIVAKTPQQWEEMAGQEIPGTPNCRGGEKK